MRKLFLYRVRSQLLIAFIVACSILTGAACDKTKTVAKLQNIADELRMHNRSILKVTNDSFAAGKVSRSFHGGVLVACKNFSKALDGADAAIVAAKKVTETGEIKSALDFAQRIIDVDVFPAFLNVAEAIVDIPPEIKEKIAEYLAAIRLLFTAIRALFADAQIAIGGRESYA